ncbi:DUF1802 family protein [Pleurocapsales cyanobacterium LEGE 10410]|nr:DUF1802 family protein [Pleurocapsales cyanobacterium LEGE 10410]
MVLAKFAQLQHALKEWAIAVEALSKGKTIILLRKGGIREAGFGVKYPLVWLYPTYEHQKPHLLKPEYADSVMPVESGWHPSTVEINSCAEVREVLPISDRQQLEALQPYHIWNEQMVSDRLKWKPRQPIMVLLLRVYRLSQSQIIPYHDAYGGCKSWIELTEPIATQELVPAIDSHDFERQVREIKALIES